MFPHSGELFSVSSWKAKRLQNLVVFNERAPYLDGFFSMTPVGAANVGSIKINFDAVYTLPPHFFFLVFHVLTCASYGDERMCVLHPLQTMHHAWSWYVKSMPWDRSISSAPIDPSAYTDTLILRPFLFEVDFVTCTDEKLSGVMIGT